MRVLRLLPSR